jgi:hypothetical protein
MSERRIEAARITRIDRASDVRAREDSPDKGGRFA